MRMFWFFTVSAIAAFSALSWPSVSRSQERSCTCGPTYCADTPAYSSALQAKKAALSVDHPARLVGLFDQLGRCEAAITTAPNGLQLFRQMSDGSIVVDGWTAENEKNGAAAVASGGLRVCRVIVVRNALACCGAQPFKERADYDSLLDLNTTATAKCEQ